ncbi:MAG: hypothetical protein IPP61_06645 [Cytophagaceae bacterium]|nr:hypothetical protein [Cytophagaceae bacterium]MBL0302022.1 hypothetical protein [Cytophagaceae bacterium]MBL0324844.1 hypothetical protein [Cytophagaceae bacterium]
MNRRKCTQSTPSLLLSFQLDTFAAKYHQKMTYLAITCSGNNLVANKEIAAQGFKGNQLRATTYPVFKDSLPTTEEPKTYSKNKSAEVKAVFEETGIQPTYHNHMHQLGETPKEIDLILHEMDTRYIKLLH